MDPKKRRFPLKKTPFSGFQAVSFCYCRWVYPTPPYSAKPKTASASLSPSNPPAGFVSDKAVVRPDPHRATPPRPTGSFDGVPLGLEGEGIFLLMDNWNEKKPMKKWQNTVFRN